MFATGECLTYRKALKPKLNEVPTIVCMDSPVTRYKPSVLSNEKTRRVVNRSPKSYVKENKENFQRLNINNMQKVRVKLKLNKK